MVNKLQGIYFKIEDDGTISYIGKTTNLANRLARHQHIVLGNKYKFLPVSNESDMAILELAYIDKFKPTLNKMDKFKEVSTLNIILPAISMLKVYSNSYYKRKVKMKGFVSCIPMNEIAWGHKTPKYPNGKKITEKPLIDNLSSSILIRLPLLFKELGSDESLNLYLPQGNTLAKCIGEFFRYKLRVSKDIASSLLKLKVLHRVNKSHYVINPFLFLPLHLAHGKKVEAQLYWQHDLIPFPAYSKYNEEEAEKLIGTLTDGIEEHLKVVSDESAKLVKESLQIEYNNPHKVSNDDFTWMVDNVRLLNDKVTEFFKFVDKTSPISYISNDAGARHFINWWNKQNVYKLKYMERNKVVRAIIQLLEDRSTYLTYFDSLADKPISKEYVDAGLDALRDAYNKSKKDN